MRCTYVGMTLAQFFAENPEMDDSTFAKEVEISRSMVTKLRLRTTKPSSDLAMRILRFTGGKVTLPDLMPIDPARDMAAATEPTS